MNCAGLECVKGESEQQNTNGYTGGVREEDERRVVSDIEGARWKALKRKRQLEWGPTLVYCPIAVCQAPGVGHRARKANLASSEPTTNSFLIAYPSHSFSFCHLCQRSWHGLALCPTSSTSPLMLEHRSSREESWMESNGSTIRKQRQPGANGPCLARGERESQMAQGRFDGVSLLWASNAETHGT